MCYDKSENVLNIKSFFLAYSIIEIIRDTLQRIILHYFHYQVRTYMRKIVNFDLLGNVPNYSTW